MSTNVDFATYCQGIAIEDRTALNGELEWTLVLDTKGFDSFTIIGQVAGIASPDYQLWLEASDEISSPGDPASSTLVDPYQYEADQVGIVCFKPVLTANSDNEPVVFGFNTGYRYCRVGFEEWGSTGIWGVKNMVVILGRANRGPNPQHLNPYINDYTL